MLAGKIFFKIKFEKGKKNYYNYWLGMLKLTF